MSQKLKRAENLNSQTSIREVLSRVREEIKEGIRQELKDLRRLIEYKIRELSGTSLIRGINATGVVINTILGRAPIAKVVSQFIKEIAQSYSNLEYDLEEGKRGSRLSHVVGQLKDFT